jgi:hypothetical protein
MILSYVIYNDFGTESVNKKPQGGYIYYK